MEFANHAETKAIQTLPFTVEIATRQDLGDVANLRASAYGKHLPALGLKLLEPEVADYEPGCEVFIARSRLDGTLLGTLRTHANVLEQLPLQASMRLPTHMLGTRMVETTRLCVKAGPNASIVRAILFKALYLYCLDQKVDWMMAAGRRPVDRIYDSLLFTDVEKEGLFYPMAHANGILHRVMCLSPSEAQASWTSKNHPMLGFFCETVHPDIRIANVADLDLCVEEHNTTSSPAHLHAPNQWAPSQSGLRF